MLENSTALRIVLPIHRMYFYYVTSFSLCVMSCVCQLFNKEYMMMMRCLSEVTISFGAKCCLL